MIRWTSADQLLAIKKAIIGWAQALLREGHVEGINLMTMHVCFMRKIGRLCLSSTITNYNMTAHIHDIELRRKIVDSGSSLTIMSLSMLEVVGTLETGLLSSLLRCQVLD